MSLNRTLEKKSLVVLGLNSGTSADGLDMAALRFTPYGHATHIRYIAGRTRRFNSNLKQLIHRLADTEAINLDELIRLDNTLGIFSGRAAASFIRLLAAKHVTVDTVASHGQTIRHLPAKRKVGPNRVHGTLQIGSPEQISAHTGKLVVADFRQADVALGGEGAPITVEAMRQLFADERESRLIVNLGGIANYFYFPSDNVRHRTRAEDCGPGNVLCDLISTLLFNERYDRNGRRALSGTVSEQLLARLLDHRFFKRRSLSTGREDFGPEFAKIILALGKRSHLSGEDLLATTAELTVRSIIQRTKTLVARDKNIRSLYLTGGGVRNKFFTRRLKECFTNLKVGTVKELGYDPDLVEAASFAVMGYDCLRSRPVQTRFNGYREPLVQPVLGRIVQPPQTRK